MVKNLTVTQENQVWSLDWEDPLEEDMASHVSILVWRIPWTGSWWARHDWTATNTHFSRLPVDFPGFTSLLSHDLHNVSRMRLAWGLLSPFLPWGNGGAMSKGGEGGGTGSYLLSSCRVCSAFMHKTRGNSSWLLFFFFLGLANWASGKEMGPKRNSNLLVTMPGQDSALHKPQVWPLPPYRPCHGSEGSGVTPGAT